eukprot:3345457-Amphidinium_carterae.2
MKDQCVHFFTVDLRALDLSLKVLEVVLLFAHRQQVLAVPVEEAIAAAKQHAMGAELKQQVLVAGLCSCFDWPPFLGRIPQRVSSTSLVLTFGPFWDKEQWKEDAKKLKEAGQPTVTYMKDMWRASPDRSSNGCVAKQLSGTWRCKMRVGFAFSPDATSAVELGAWSKL